MTVRMIKRSWWIDFRINRRRYRKRRPENSKAGAHAYEASLRQKLARGEQIDPITKTMQKEELFERFAERWFKDYVEPTNRHSEQMAKKYILRSSLVPYFGNTPVHEITGYM